MDLNLAILYTIFMVGLIGYHHDVKPPHKNVSSVILKGKIKTIVFIDKHVFKYRYIQIICTFIMIFIFVYINHLSYLYLIAPFILIFFTPCLAYSNILNMIEWVGYLILPILMYFDFENDYVFLYFIFSLIVICFLIIKMEFSIYPKKINFELKSNKYFIISISFLAYILLSEVSIIKIIPIELSVIFIALFFCTNIEAKITSNKAMLNTYRNRAYLICIKSKKISTLFFSSTEVDKIINSLLSFFVFLSMVVIYNGMLVDYLVFFIGIILILIFNIDIFLNHYIFQKSIIYENKVVRKVIELAINTTVFQYGLFYIVNKILLEYNMFDIAGVSFNYFRDIFKIINGIVYIVLVTILYIHIKKLFTINNLIKDDSL